ncbi:hypothetical protein FNJ59_14355, partial [Bacteroides pyogenes]
EIFKISQLKDNEPICIAMNKKGSASCITTHLLIFPVWKLLFPRWETFVSSVGNFGCISGEVWVNQWGGPVY